MKKIWIHKSNSFKEANEFDVEYYSCESPRQRLSDMQFCREMYFKLKGITNAGRRRLRRVIRIIKQA